MLNLIIQQNNLNEVKQILQTQFLEMGFITKSNNIAKIKFANSFQKIL